MRNRPRRAGSRWREGAPAFVLDCFDDPRTADRYTILFAEPIDVEEEAWPYLGCSMFPTHPSFGISQWGELDRYQLANYRLANGRYRVRWLDLPGHIRAHAVARWLEGEIISLTDPIVTVTASGRPQVQL